MTATGKWQYPKQAATPGRKCKDCVAEGFTDTKRPAPHPGPRCASHDRAEKRRRRLAGKVRHVERTYGLTEKEYNELLAFQGGQCAFRCGATGASKRLAVDHDHHQAMLDGHDPDKGCPKCVRGLVCSTCNDVLAHARSMAAFFARGQAYLKMWPTQRMRIGMSWPPPQGSV